MATPFPTTGTMQGDIDAGLLVNGVYNPNIDVSKITPTNPVSLPDPAPTNDYAAILASLKTSLPEEKTVTDTQGKITEKTKELGGESAFLAEKQDELGVNVDRKALKDLQTQLTSVNTEATASILNLDRQGDPTRLTAASTLDKSNIEKDRTIKALRLSASIQAIQGNLELANDQAIRSVKLKFDPIRAELDVLEKQLDFNYKSFTSAEKKRADALKEANDIRRKELDKEEQLEENWIRTKNSALSDGVPLGIVNTAQQFFDAKQEDKARSLLGSYVKPKTNNTINNPISILDVARYNEAYPQAGVTAGDTESQANAKVKALSQPKNFTDEEFRTIARESKDKEKKSYEDTIAEIESNPFIANKDRAKLVTSEIYGKQAKQQSVRQQAIEQRITELKKGNILKDSDIRYSLKRQGFSPTEVNNSSVGAITDKFIDSLSSFLFK